MCFYKKLMSVLRGKRRKKYKQSLFKIDLYMNFVKPMYYHKSDKKKMK